MAAIHQMRKAIGETRLENCLMQFPINHVGNGIFEIAPGINCRIAPRGAAYMNNRIRNRKGHFSPEVLEKFSWRSFTSLAKEALLEKDLGNVAGSNRAWDALAKHINDAKQALCDVNIDQPIHALLVNGELRGTPTKLYDFFEHEKVVDQIQKNGLANNISFWSIDAEKLRVCFTVDTIGNAHGSDTLIAVCLTNGHAGFDALKLEAEVRNNNYSYIIPGKVFEGKPEGDDQENTKFVQKNRHLSWIEQVFGNIKDMLEKTGQINFVETLKKMSAVEFLNLLANNVDQELLNQKRTEEIINWVRRQVGISLYTGFDVFVEITNYSNTRGYKSAVEKLLTPTLDKVFDDLCQ